MNPLKYIINFLKVMFTLYKNPNGKVGEGNCIFLLGFGQSQKFSSVNWQNCLMARSIADKTKNLLVIVQENFADKNLVNIGGYNVKRVFAGRVAKTEITGNFLIKIFKKLMALLRGDDWFGTYQVLEKMVAEMKDAGKSKPILIANFWHVARCYFCLKSIGVETIIIPPRLPKWLCPEDKYIAVHNLWIWLPVDAVRKFFYTVSKQINISKI